MRATEHPPAATVADAGAGVGQFGPGGTGAGTGTTGAFTGVHHADTASTPPRPAGPPQPSHPTFAPGPSPASAPAAPASKGFRGGLVAASLVLAVLAGAGAALWLTDGDDSKDDAKSPAARQEAQAPPASPDPARASSTPKASPSAASSPKAAYTVVFQDKPLTLRTPSSGTGTHVDLDAPKVHPNGKIGKIPDMELTYQTWSDEGLEFLTATGRSPGSTPEECREAVGTDAMPSKLYGDQLRPGKVLPKGTVLCTVTSDGNLAMLRITDVLIDTSRSALNPMPDYVTTLTLWKTG
ncbi:hypothetical protein OTB20_10340 [Streptomyces sp. H27-H1]|uniref:hypothetical protein n=1 Tax=Streptomyces sp. H27-H1 TaxID=2996461 RepID=UPI00226D8C8C|nr:hypothetical protein [Streptomyces sp. H27-H1]MCY0926597.1 hypothetical protein [Streptomyces sp. H27-H1]